MGNIGRRALTENVMAGNEVSSLVKRQYENRITDLERQLNERNSGPSPAMVERMRKQIEQRYLDLIDLVKAKPSEEANTPSFRNKLLAELQEANQELESEIASSLDGMGRSHIDRMGSLSNGAAFKRGHSGRGSVARMSREIDQNAGQDHRAPTIQLEETVRKYERANHSLQADLEVLKMQQMKSDVIRNHLECQLREILRTVNEEPSNPSRTMEELRRRLNEENEELEVMLREEVEARKRAEEARLKGTQTLKEFQDSITNGLDNRFERLESDQVILSQQNRIGAQALETQRMQITELQQIKTLLESELTECRKRCEELEEIRELDAEEKRHLVVELQEAEIERASSGDLEHALASWKQKADSYRDRIEAAEVARVKAEKSESFAYRCRKEASGSSGRS
ncbi:hypothetical protein CROQUDRAFT_603875 [Cronartium quercuum f. sp. fusiforme G11]|uniref:Uncharacterized protein n=1 Tax=Cronartium quercuum f. sp. fusiforme G11 TaxID=708437 RepID=A0A9P6TA62_9BASI|nr:hypothetical protein CROQUDRAFT_603875 [Cronartium quercuum f. sp. fusiforme G11]